MSQDEIIAKEPSPCNCLNIRRAASAMTALYDAFLAPCGLTVGQQSILRHIRALGPVSVSDLAGQIRLDRTTLVRNLRPLEEAGLIADVSAPGARSRELQLTAKGMEKCAEAKKLWDKAQQYIETLLGRDELVQLTALLSKIENLEAEKF